jgi:hypothetical protein
MATGRRSLPQVPGIPFCGIPAIREKKPGYAGVAVALSLLRVAIAQLVWARMLRPVDFGKQHGRIVVKTCCKQRHIWHRG